jgi:TatD DNase family protein
LSSGSSQLEIIDSHAHLESEDFDPDRAETLERAKSAGVQNILAIGSGGSGPDHLDAAIAVAKDYDWIYATVGIHPQHAAEAQEQNYAQLDVLAKNPKVIAWGEMGLDYHYEEPPPEIQQPVFRRQLQQARAARLPIIIHCRDAWDDCLAILEKDWKPSGLGGIFHCFTGTLREAQLGLEMGFLVSFAANITYPKSQQIRDVARDLPLDQILTETDSPFLSPQGRRGKRNEPAHVVEVAQTLANVRNLGREEVAATTAANFRRLFRLGGQAIPAQPR